MSGVKLKDIPGVLVEKYHVMPDLICKDCILSARESHREGFNQGIESQGNVSITLNRERLVKVLSGLCEPGSFYTTRMAVDAIIANQKDLLERGEE